MGTGAPPGIDSNSDNTGGWFRSARKVRRDFARREADVKSTLYAADFAAFATRTEGGGSAPSAGASGAPHSVNEVLGHLRKIVIHNMGDAFDVDTAGGYIGGHQDTVLAVLESVQGLVTLVLCAAAMDASGLHASAGKVSWPDGPCHAWCARTPGMYPALFQSGRPAS